MSDRKLLDNLVKKFVETRNKKNWNRCVGFATQDFVKYYFSMSGFKYDYKGTLCFGKKNINLERNYNEIKKQLFDLVKGNRNAEQTSLFDNCLSTKLRNSRHKIYFPINILEANNLLKMIGEYNKDEYEKILYTSYSCVERKIIFSKFQPNLSGSLFISMKPCDLCSPFTNKFDVYNDVKDVYKRKNQLFYNR